MTIVDSTRVIGGGGGGEGPDSRYILKVEPTAFPDGLNMECEKKGTNQVFWFEHMETELPSADMGEPGVEHVRASEGEAFSCEHIELGVPLRYVNGNTERMLDV